LWDDPTITIEQLASQLNISQKKLMRIAEQLNLPLRPNSRKRWEVQQYASANPTRSRYKTGNLEAYRALWLQGMSENPDAGISELRRKLPTPFSWLRRHDMEWFNNHKPPSKRVFPIKRKPIDWDARDIQISEAVKSSAQQLKSITEYPVQVTINAIGVRTGYLQAIKKRLDKLPLTAKILSEVVETREDFGIRRIWWAVDRYQEENIRPTRRQLMFRCFVQEAVAELPRVQEALELAWRFLQSIEESESSHSQP
jgi:hypothetical protein